MGMQVTPTGQTIYVPDGLLGPMPPPQAPADVTPVGALPVDGQPTPLPGEPQPAAPWMPGQLPPDVASAASSGFAPPPLPSMPNQSQPRPTQNMPDFYAPPVQPMQPPSKQQVAQQAAQSKYAASPQGMQDASAAGQIGVLGDQAANVTAQGDIAAKQADEQYALKAKQVADEQAVAAQQQAQQQAYLIKRQKEHDDLNAQAVAAAKAHVDPGRMWSSMSTGSKVQAGIGVLLAGIGQGLNGDHGANPAMKLITDAIDRDVDAQKVNVEQLNKSFGMKREVLGDADTQQTKTDDMINMKRASDRVAVADQLEAAAMKYASPLAKLTANQQANTLRAQAFQITGQLADKRVAQAHQDAELAVQKQNANTAGYSASIADRTERHNDVYHQQELARQLMHDQGEAAAKVEAAKAKASGKLTGKEAELGMGGTPRAVKNPDGSTGFELPAAMNRDGSPVQFATKEEAAKIRPMKADTDEAIESIDALRQLREQSGPTTDISKNASWQKEHSRFASIKRAVMGSEAFSRASDSQQKLVEEQLGQLEDPTRWNGIQPGLTELRRTLIDNLRHTVNSNPGNNFDADAAYPDLAKPAASTDDEKLLLRSPTVDEVLGPPKVGNNPVESATNAPMIRDNAFKAMGGENLMSPAQKEKLDALIDAAFTKNDAKAKAMIEDAAKNSESEGIKSTAQHALNVHGIWTKFQAGGK